MVAFGRTMVTDILVALGNKLQLMLISWKLHHFSSKVPNMKRKTLEEVCLWLHERQSEHRYVQDDGQPLKRQKQNFETVDDRNEFLQVNTDQPWYSDRQPTVSLL